MADTNETIIRTLYQAVNDRDWARLESLAAEQAEIEDLPFASTTSFIERLRMWMDAFPDTEIEVKKLVGSGDTVVAEISAVGTHRGRLETPERTLPPTNRRVEASICAIWELADGKIMRGRNYFDWAGMERDLGLREQMPNPRRVEALEESAFPPH